MFKGLSVAKNYLRPESATLTLWDAAIEMQLSFCVWDP